MHWWTIVGVVVVGVGFAVSMFALARLLNRKNVAAESSPSLPLQLVANVVGTTVLLFVMYVVNTFILWIAGFVSLAGLWLWFWWFNLRSRRRA